MEEKDYKRFEKNTLVFLRIIGFTPSGYYRYPHGSDISGSLAPQGLFKVPTRAMVEITRDLPGKTTLERFHNLAKDSLAQREIIISPTPFAKLDPEVQSLIGRLEIEFFDEASVSNLLSRNKIDEGKIREDSKLYEMVGPSTLAKNLPEIAKQVIPLEMESAVKELDLKPWQAFEDAVFAIFHYCFGYTTRKMGAECLFEHEPEGIVLIGVTDSRYATLYECKTARETYDMTSDHELRYKDYIKGKKGRVEVLENAPLRYFLIVAPGFSGDIKQRRQKIHDDTGVWTVFMPATVLSSLGRWAAELPNDLKNLLDMRALYKIDELIVSDETANAYMKKFREENKSRW